MPKIARINPIMEVLKSAPGRVSRIYIQQDSPNKKIKEVHELARRARVTVIFTPKKHLDRMDRRHQGIVADTAPKGYASLDDILEGKENPFLVLLDGIEDPQNLGAIIRTAECAGVDGLILPERRSAGLTEAVYTVSAGALEYLDVAIVKNLARTMDVLREQGIWLIGAEGSGTKPWYDFDFTLPIALIMGSEGKGLHELIKKKCDEILSLPLLGHISSLNVSAAASVFFYEVVRQRTGR